jgi:hypothetical protein
MQGDPGSSRSLDKKRKYVDGSSSSSSPSVNAIVPVPGKKAKKSTSPSETGETGKTEAQWPDYFKEVSVQRQFEVDSGNFASVSYSRCVHG